MGSHRRSLTARVAATILVTVLSITSLVLARALIGIEITVDAVPVAKGEVDGGVLELHTLPTWQTDGDLRLYYDDGSREDGFARLSDGDVVVTTIDFGTESLGDYLRRLGIDGFQVPIESSCEIMNVEDPLFGMICAAFDPGRQPPDHPDTTGTVCSTCHDASDLQATFGRVTDFAPTGATPPPGHREIGTTPCSTCHVGATGDGAVVSSPRTPPPGHRPIGTKACSSCHGGASGGDGGTPAAATPPAGHRPIGTAVCSSCHGEGGYDDDDHDEDHEDEHDDDDDDEHDDEHDDEDDD